MGSSLQAAFPSCFGLNQESPNLLVWQNIKRTVKSAMHGSKWDLPPQLPHPSCSFINLDIGIYQFYKVSIVQEALHQGKRRTPQIGDSDINWMQFSVARVAVRAASPMCCLLNSRRRCCFLTLVPVPPGASAVLCRGAGWPSRTGAASLLLWAQYEFSGPC